MARVWQKCNFRSVQRSVFCGSWRELSNEYLLAQFGFDTAENEPSNIWRNFANIHYFEVYFLPAPRVLFRCLVVFMQHRNSIPFSAAQKQHFPLRRCILAQIRCVGGLTHSPSPSYLIAGVQKGIEIWAHSALLSSYEACCWKKNGRIKVKASHQIQGYRVLFLTSAFNEGDEFVVMLFMVQSQLRILHRYSKALVLLDIERVALLREVFPFRSRTRNSILRNFASDNHTINDEYKVAGLSDPKEDPPLSPREALCLILWWSAISKELCSKLRVAHHSLYLGRTRRFWKNSVSAISEQFSVILEQLSAISEPLCFFGTTQQNIRTWMQRLGNICTHQEFRCSQPSVDFFLRCALWWDCHSLRATDDSDRILNSSRIRQRLSTTIALTSRQFWNLGDVKM